MKHAIKSVVLGLLLLLTNGSIAYAQDFKKGSEAYKKKDYATALREWRPLAAQGDADAQYNLGLIYDNGQGVTQDFAEALKWYRLSAAQGNGSAQYHLGLMYLSGEGVTQDYQEAAHWFRLVAALGGADAQYNLGVMYGNGDGVIKDNVYAHMWFNVAASNGNTGGAQSRDSIAKSMTAADISKAQDLARACVQKNYKGC
jgi:TPR repeat protein